MSIVLGFAKSGCGTKSGMSDIMKPQAAALKSLAYLKFFWQITGSKRCDFWSKGMNLLSKEESV